MKNPWVIIGLITVVLFGGAIWYSSFANERNNEGVEVVGVHVTGNPDAAVTLTEYSDLQCPACAAFHPVIKDLLAEYGEELRFEYKHFPLPIHPYAQQAAVAAEAAGQQGEFFAYHDLLFENQQQWSQAATPNVLFIEYAEALELDIPTFRRHMNSTLLREKVRSDMSEGRQLGVNSTPTFYLNGERMDPNEFQTYQGFVAAVTAAVDPTSATSTEPAAEVGAEAGADVRFGI